MSWEVAIVGGGPAGALAAYVLARAGRRVLLVDAPSAATRKIGESLPAIASHLLGKLGLRALLDTGHRSSFGNVSAWGTSELVATDFISDPHGLGWHLDRLKFDRDLRAAASAAGAELCLDRLRSVARAASGWTLKLDRGTELAACVIDATGRRASIARHEGAIRTRDDALVALYQWVTPAPTGEPTDERTLVESGAHGWWYTAPLPDDVRVLALHVDADVARRIRRTKKDFASRSLLAATRHITTALPGVVFEPRSRVAEACGARLDAFVGRGWVATGDAALSFDPIAAQGIFNALYTGMKAGEAVEQALRGDPSGLAAYSRRLEEIRAVYLARHREVYALEARFDTNRFWHRRVTG